MTETPDQPALPPLLAAARALELDRDAASSGESDDYRRGMTRAVKLLRLLNEDEPAAASSAVPAPATDRAAGVAEAIRTFPFDNFGMDDVSFALEDDPEAQEWVPALADAVLATLPATTARAVELRDYWHAEAMSATTRIIELEGQLEELRRMADETPQQPEAEEPTEEQIVREHVTTVHLIGEQLAAVESWMWERLAEIRAVAPAVVAQPDEEA